MSSLASAREYRYVPSLVCLCIEKLALYPDQIAGVALTYAPPEDSTQFDILKALIPFYADDSFGISLVDPCLWATLVQIFGTSLPEIFTTYQIPLKHTLLPLLQRIPSTPTFSLVTILELPGCTQLTDDLALTLRSLHTLTAFDASDTALSSWGLRKLLMPALLVDDTEQSPMNGPWGLRMLRLRNCKAVDQTIFKSLEKLLLLSVLDLRGTSIDPATIPTPYKAWSTACLEQSLLSSLYHPTPLTESMSSLKSLSPELHSSTAIFQLHIDRINHRPPEQKKSGYQFGYHKPPEIAVEIHNKAFTFTASTMLSHAPQPADVDAPRELRPASKRGDYMLSVAKHESEELAARQKIRNFYSAPLVRRSSTVSNEGYSARKYYTEYARKEQMRCKQETSLPKVTWPRFGDSRRPQKQTETSSNTSLMLYRPPPPWSCIESLAPDTHISESSSQPSTSRTAVTKIASLSKSHPRMQMIADLKVGMGTRSRSTVMATFDGVRSPSSAPIAAKIDIAQTVGPMLHGRNPFRRPDAVSGCYYSGFFLHGASFRQASSRGATFDQDRETSSKRILKPISSVRVPELPPEEMRKLKESMTKKPRGSLPATLQIVLRKESLFPLLKMGI
ncbi:hypothetical protein BT96DRAFT_885104 [Gymnopus androsaceus JB14]|uniref:RNI-like protein n=1 Tax=Gymnopus androsaceus JB14 TaxID=1447944 RepID=A0A6A4HEE2_9AGAR|nr:hypothetical protein BT96DRAFT_885104 [Gymnopus androsaceus JB14]